MKDEMGKSRRQFQFARNRTNPLDYTKWIKKTTIQVFVGSATERELAVWLKLEKVQLVIFKYSVQQVTISLDFHTILSRRQIQFEILKNSVSLITPLSGQYQRQPKEYSRE